MSGSSTETESMSGGEEEMAMMSITDVIPVSRNPGECSEGTQVTIHQFIANTFPPVIMINLQQDPVLL